MGKKRRLKSAKAKFNAKHSNHPRMKLLRKEELEARTPELPILPEPPEEPEAVAPPLKVAPPPPKVKKAVTPKKKKAPTLRKRATKKKTTSPSA
jgi:hypothetical protein|tara:strand:+ start:1330 stop:1611 length:282 start_codon:yes stop_codon:yes gene_type:complete